MKLSAMRRKEIKKINQKLIAAAAVVVFVSQAKKW